MKATDKARTYIWPRKADQAALDALLAAWPLTGLQRAMARTGVRHNLRNRL